MRDSFIAILAAAVFIAVSTWVIHTYFPVPTAGVTVEIVD